MTTDTVQESPLDGFVFMEKTLSILDVGMKTEKNVVLYGPGGHGKSEFVLAYLYDKGINPYVITMGSGMTPDRLFGGINIPVLNDEGKLEYLVENSFMNHEFVIFEEMLDAPDYILETLKDILSSGFFRNGTQVYPIKTKLIIACTNRTRAEFSKNDSLRALLERFPLEHNVIWDAYTDISYNTLLGKRFGADSIDPVIPFILHEYHKKGVTISPRIALDAYEVYAECGPDALMFIADFAKKPELIKDGLKRYKSTIEFKKLSQQIEEASIELPSNSCKTKEQKQAFVASYNIIQETLKQVRKITVTDDLVQVHTDVVKKANEKISLFESRYYEVLDQVTDSVEDIVESLEEDWAVETPVKAPRKPRPSVKKVKYT